MKFTNMLIFLNFFSIYLSAVEFRTEYKVRIKLNDKEEGNGKFFTKSITAPSKNEEKGFFFEMVKIQEPLKKIMIKSEGETYYLPYRYLTMDFKYTNPTLKSKYLTTMYTGSNSKDKIEIKIVFEYLLIGRIMNDDTGNAMITNLNANKYLAHVKLKTLKQQTSNLAKEYLNSLDKINSANGGTQEKLKQEQSAKDLIKATKNNQNLIKLEYEKKIEQISIKLKTLATLRNKQSLTMNLVNQNVENIKAKKELISNLKGKTKVALGVLASQLDAYKKGMNCKLDSLKSTETKKSEKVETAKSNIEKGNLQGYGLSLNSI